MTTKAKYLAFDTETTGLFDFKLAAEDPSQPRLASVAFILADETGAEVDRSKHYIRPNGWAMTESAGAVNGLTDAFLMENGVDVRDVLDIYTGYVMDGLIAAAFNVQFDCKMMRGELRRAGMPDLFEQTANTCLMRGLAPYKAQGLAIKGGQFVKLSVACEFFKIVNADAHDAMGDAEAALALLGILIRDGNLIPPKVHYAKVRPEAAA